MNLLAKARSTGPEIVSVTPASAGWRYVGFSAHRLQPKETLALDGGERERCVVVLTGTVTVRAGAKVWGSIGSRRSVFEPVSPFAVYLPPGAHAEVSGEDAAEIAICSAPAPRAQFEARLIEPRSMKRSVRGRGTNTRYVCDILPQTEPAESLLVVEVLTPQAHSSSYPPHKHDRDLLPVESLLEETYYHRLNPAQGFAFQRVYTDDRSLDQALAVEDHDVVMVPKGYHPVVMPHGYDGYYLNTMAGPTREWHFHNDPAHEWMLKG